jgi:transglutaminase-like putative cysteine protease
MIYDIRHITRYRYAAPVGFSTGLMRLTPMADADQRVLSHAIEITPRPSHITRTRCFFGMELTRVLIEQPHTSLSIIARARVVVERTGAPPLFADPPWEVVRAQALGGGGLEPRDPAHFLFPSRRVPRNLDAEAYAARSFVPGRPILAAADDLMQRIRAEFRYDPDATAVNTPLDAVMAGRHGVCQDFAHVMIAGLRGLGLPAAYVSGYLRTIPPPGKPRLAGADASHAWIALWCGPDWGWVGFDPTNAIRVGDDHIVIAMGRDYADVAPIDGVILASGGSTLDVAVDVVPVTDERMPAFARADRRA